MGNKNLLLIELVNWLDLQDPRMDDVEQNQILKEILMNLTNPNDDTEDFMELMIPNMEHIFIYFIKLKNVLARYHQFYPEVQNFLVSSVPNGFFAKLQEWLVNFENYINKDNNFADVTDLLVSWQADVDFVNSKFELIKNLLIQYLHMKDILKKYQGAYDALVLLYT